MPKKRDVVFALISSLTFFLFTFFTFKFILDKSSFTIESGILEKDMELVDNVLSEEFSSVVLLATDWAHWDDLYYFVQDLNKEFIETNLTNETLRNADIDFILFFDTYGNLVYKKMIQRDLIATVDVPGEFVSGRTEGGINENLIDVSNEEKGIHGFIDVAKGHVIFTAQPVMKSTGEGPSRGTLVMGKYLTSQDIDDVKSSFGLEFELYEHTNLPANIVSIIGTELEDQTIIKNLAWNQNVAYKYLYDYRNYPSMLVEIKSERPFGMYVQNVAFMLSGVATVGFFVIRFINCALSAKR